MKTRTLLAAYWSCVTILALMSFFVMSSLITQMIMFVMLATSGILAAINIYKSTFTVENLYQ